MRSLRRLRRLAPLPLVACAVAFGTVESAYAREKGFWGPVQVDGRSQFPIYNDLGVTIYQYPIRWDGIAPTRPNRPTDPRDPAYKWPADLDYAIQEARRYGIKVAVTIRGAPKWANGGKDWRWAPKNGRQFGNFAEAASRRYPDVRFWMVWTEPSNALLFQPVYPLTKEHGNSNRLPARQRTAPRRYAQLVDATRNSSMPPTPRSSESTARTTSSAA